MRRRSARISAVTAVSSLVGVALRHTAVLDMHGAAPGFGDKRKPVTASDAKLLSAAQ